MFWKRRSSARAKKRHGRTRQLAGWLLLIIGVLITTVWGASRWWEFGHRRQQWSASAGGGIIRIRIFSSLPVVDRWHAARLGKRAYWQWFVNPDIQPSDSYDQFNVKIASVTVWRFPGIPRSTEIDLAAWPFALAPLLSGGLLVWMGNRACRRAKIAARLCHKCGYDLRGLAAGSPCPECGSGVIAWPSP